MKYVIVTTLLISCVAFAQSNEDSVRVRLSNSSSETVITRDDLNMIVAAFASARMAHDNPAPEPSADKGLTFKYPKVDGALIAQNFIYSDQPSTEAFCKLMGLKDAIRFEVSVANKFQNSQPPKLLGLDRYKEPVISTVSDYLHDYRFSSITCRVL